MSVFRVPVYLYYSILWRDYKIEVYSEIQRARNTIIITCCVYGHFSFPETILKINLSTGRTLSACTPIWSQKTIDFPFSRPARRHDRLDGGGGGSRRDSQKIARVIESPPAGIIAVVGLPLYSLII